MWPGRHIHETVSSHESGGEEVRVVIETEGLTHVQLVVRDVHRSLAFYETAFGMEVHHWDGDRMVFIGTPGRRDTITLNQSEDVERAGMAGGVDHIGFRLLDKSRLDDAVAAVIDAGGRVVERGQHSPEHPFAYVADPDGYVIEL
jgi:catechol 2,3-dioxygenase-like lactoylglutathione lyase family enzyme